MNLRQSLSLMSLLLTIALISWLWLSDNVFNLISPTSVLQTNTPDFVITQVNSQQFDEQGQLKYTLQAKELQHYPNGIALLKEPQLELSDSEQAIWRINAKTGEVNDSTQQASLDQQVKISQPNKTNLHPWQLTTKHLSIDLDHTLVETDQPVYLTDALGQLEAQGMRSHLSTHQIDLLAQVRGRYAPH